MAQKTFDEWLPSYLEFRARAAILLKKSVSSETSELQRESQELEPMRWEAEEARAFAESFYYQAKATGAEQLIAGGWPRSSAFEAAKAKSHRQLWARENTKGLCKVIDSRSMKVAQHLKLLDSSR